MFTNTRIFTAHKKTQTPTTAAFKVNYKALKNILETYKDLPGTASIDDIKNPEDITKIKGLMKAIGVNMNTKRLATLRLK